MLSLYVLPGLYIIHILWYIFKNGYKLQIGNRELQIHTYILFKFSSKYINQLWNFEHVWKVSPLCMNECFAPCHHTPCFWFSFDTYIWILNIFEKLAHCAWMSALLHACANCKAETSAGSSLTQYVCTCRHLCTLSPKEKLSAVCSAKKVEMEPVFDLSFSPPSTAATAVSTALRTGCHVKLHQCCHPRQFFATFYLLGLMVTKVMREF